MTKQSSNLLQNNSNDKIVIDFAQFPNSFRSIKYDSFTNYLSDCFDFFEQLKNIFEKLIPFISGHTFDDIYSASNKHSHPIKSNTKERELVENVIKEKLKKDNNYNDNDIKIFFINNINDYEIWQLGMSGGTRIVGIRYMNRFKPIFFDYHHLIYPDEKYNNPNYDKYNFCPMNGGCKYEKKGS